MFLFTELVKKLECDAVIESGGRLGGSTSFLSALLEIPITAIGSEECQLPNVSSMVGDARTLIPQFLEANTLEQKIAILIDGPKGEQALKLAKQALDSGKVRFVAIHDLTEKEADGSVYSSKAEPFRKAFGFLDENVGEYLEKYPDGPGLTIFANEPI